MKKNQRTRLPWYKNIFQIPFIGWLIRLPVYPYVLQVGALIFFALLIYFGWNQPVFEMNSAAEKLYRKLNFTTFVVWGLWWTSMIWIAFFIGRAWCHVCPLELIMNVAERFGRRLGVSQKLLPKMFRNGILIILGYLFVQFAVASFHIHRAPQGAALFLISLSAIAFIFGFFFKYRSFCSYICPVGILLNCYSRNAPFELRIIDKATCDKCKTKDCRSLKTYHQWNSRGCPSLLNPPKLDSNKDCLLCMQCVKACPYNNIRFGVRKFFKDIVPGEKTGMAIPLFLIIITGFLTYELTLNKELKAFFLAAPHWAEHILGVTNPHGKGFLKGLWTLVIFPSAIWLTFASAFKLFSGKSFKSYFATYALAFIPLLVSAHLSKALDKWNGWLKGIDLPFRDPFGVETFQAIFVDKTLAEPGKIVALSTLRWLPLIILFVGMVVTLIKITQANKLCSDSSLKITNVSKFIPYIMALFISFIFIYNVWVW
jgi:polyferredoxin